MTFSYWAIDYPRAFDMIQYRLYIMRKLLKVIVSSPCQLALSVHFSLGTFTHVHQLSSVSK